MVWILRDDYTRGPISKQINGVTYPDFPPSSSCLCRARARLSPCDFLRDARVREGLINYFIGSESIEEENGEE